MKEQAAKANVATASSRAMFAQALRREDEGKMTSRVVCAALSAALLSLSAGAFAQGSIFDQGKKLLESLGNGGTRGLGTDEIAAGLREALRLGSARAVEQVGAVDGFNADSAIHIPLPGPLQDVQSMLRTVGMSDLADDLELKLNRAAEAAAPEAKELFVQAISEMTLEDVRDIYSGPEDAATQYFKGKMSPTLAERMNPIVGASLSDVGAIRSYEEMMSQYKAIPFAPDVRSDLTGYVVDQALDGIFYYVGKEEAAIRNDPAARTTELLKTVFGSG
jgi:hypothetical protein